MIRETNSLHDNLSRFLEPVGSATCSTWFYTVPQLMNIAKIFHTVFRRFKIKILMK